MFELQGDPKKCGKLEYLMNGIENRRNKLNLRQSESIDGPKWLVSRRLLGENVRISGLTLGI